MFHLFNKVYLYSDCNIDINHDRAVLSKEYGIPMYIALDKVCQGELILHSSSVDEAIKGYNLKGFDELIRVLEQYSTTSGKMLIVYCDDDNFVDFTSRWFKRVFKNIDAAAAWKILDAYITKQKRQQSWRFNNSSMIHKLYDTISFEKFKEVFESVETPDEVDEVFGRVKPGFSLELLVASYLYDGSNEDGLCSNVENILTRTVQEILLEIKHTVYKNQYKPTFDIDYDIKFFQDSSIYTTSTLGNVGSSCHLEIKNASNKDIETFKKIAKQVYVEWDGFREDSDIIQRLELISIAKDGVTKQELDYLIDMEKTSKSNIRLYSVVDEEKINTIFLDTVFTLSKEELKAYEMR